MVAWASRPCFFLKKTRARRPHHLKIPRLCAEQESRARERRSWRRNGSRENEFCGTRNSSRLFCLHRTIAMLKVLAILVFLVLWLPSLLISNLLTEGSDMGAGLGCLGSVAFAFGTAAMVYRLSIQARSRRRSRAGLCHICCHDIRKASDHCPECGEILAVKSGFPVILVSKPAFQYDSLPGER